MAMMRALAMRLGTKRGVLLSRSLQSRAFNGGRVLNEEENMCIKSRDFCSGMVWNKEEHAAEKMSIKGLDIGCNIKEITPRMPAQYVEMNNWSPVLSNYPTDWECNWESLTDEEYEAFLLTFQKSTTGVTRSRFSSDEEYAACRKRHHRYVMSVAKELSVLFEGTDFEKLKGTQDFTNQI